MAKFLEITVIGCGRLGSILASHFSQQGHNVVVIDRDKSAFEHLTEEFSGFAIYGDAAEMQVLQEAKLEQADCAIAVTGKDNLNIMVSQLAKTVFDVPIVLTRILEPAREEIYQKLGLTIISTTKISATAFFQTLQQQLEENVS
ncbi:MAG: TrkA family potassium uptake protein [Xenococcaceae cyanobacterium MO_167.B27]|nr:TrkA family potassium uptake protein [Xenococcaceae cyanobacterium MO_167.B27]